MGSPKPILYMLSERWLAGFWKLVDTQGPDDCWPWNGAEIKMPGGITYGRFALGSAGVMLAHRIAWTAHHQQDIPEGLIVLRTCLNSLCCNPQHLITATKEQLSRQNDPGGRHSSYWRRKLAKKTKEVKS